MSIDQATTEDKRGLIASSYQIEGLDIFQARSIFLDWAMMDSGDDVVERVRILHDRFAHQYPNHPMSTVLAEGMIKKTSTKRRGRRLR